MNVDIDYFVTIAARAAEKSVTINGSGIGLLNIN